MGMQINNNLAANNTYRNLSNTQTDLGKSLEKLSSGLRINRASDDAAGLALSEGLRSQIGGLTVASRNAQDGINAVQTAEGGLNQAQAILQRLRDLGVQAANDTNNEKSRDAIQTEANSLVDEIERIGNSTNFNGTSLLNGAKKGPDALQLQVGANGDRSSTITVDLGSADLTTIALALRNGVDAVTTGGSPGVRSAGGVKIPPGGVGGSTYTVAQGTGPGADTFTFTIAQGATPNGATAGTLEFFSQVEGHEFKITYDGASDSFNFVSTDETRREDVKVYQGTGTTGSEVASMPGTEGYVAATETTPARPALDFTSAGSAREAIDTLTAQITAVSTARAEMGASQNRLESAVKTISTAKENLTAAESRIRDTDMAEEMVKFTRNNILSQAGTAMLAQANQSNQGVLQLLR